MGAGKTGRGAVLFVNSTLSVTVDGTRRVLSSVRVLQLGGVLCIVSGSFMFYSGLGQDSVCCRGCITGRIIFFVVIEPLDRRLN